MNSRTLSKQSRLGQTFISTHSQLIVSISCYSKWWDLILLRNTLAINDEILLICILGMYMTYKVCAFAITQIHPYLVNAFFLLYATATLSWLSTLLWFYPSQHGLTISIAGFTCYFTYWNSRWIRVKRHLKEESDEKKWE